MDILELWSVMKHNIAILKIRVDVSADSLSKDYEDVISFIHGAGEESIKFSIEYLNSHPNLNDKMEECLERYCNEFKAINSDPMDVAKAANLIEFVKNFPKYIAFDLEDSL